MSGPKTRSKLSLEKRYNLKKKSINATAWKKSDANIMVNKNPIRMFFSPIEGYLRGGGEHTKNLINYYSGKKKQKQRAEKRIIDKAKKNVIKGL